MLKTITKVIAILIILCAKVASSQTFLPKQIRRLAEHHKKADQKSMINVVVFIGIDCPISQKYMSQLNQLAISYRDKNVQMLAIVPGKVKKSERSAFVFEYKVDEGVLPVLTDDKFELVRYFNATITPEVFVLDQQEKVRYVGAIDDWFYDLGHSKQIVAHNYLKDAIEAILNNQDIQLSKTVPIGCIIQQPSKVN